MKDCVNVVRDTRRKIDRAFRNLRSNGIPAYAFRIKGSNCENRELVQRKLVDSGWVSSMSDFNSDAYKGGFTSLATHHRGSVKEDASGLKRFDFDELYIGWEGDIEPIIKALVEQGLNVIKPESEYVKIIVKMSKEKEGVVQGN